MHHNGDQIALEGALKLKEVAYRNLALTAKPTGLTSVFQAPRSATNSIGYLMDNCEGYRGLRDLASLLRDRGETGDAGWAYLNTTTPGWEDGHCDPYPWAILGTVAAMRGQTALARLQLASIERKFVSNRALVTISLLAALGSDDRQRLLSHADFVELPVSHVLGVRRASVTLAAGALQKLGLIRYTRGHILVVDRRGLLNTSCTCYAQGLAMYQRIMDEAH